MFNVLFGCMSVFFSIFGFFIPLEGFMSVLKASFLKSCEQPVSSLRNSNDPDYQ